MKINIRTALFSSLGCGLALGALTVQASTDYTPAIWRQAYKNHWYTSGNGHKFCVVHDMEGYYWTTISYFQMKSTSASSHYVTNGKKDNSSDSAPGEVTQMVREAHYGWHALCWNTHSFGTEHEGFASNPAWFTYEHYKSSADLHRHLCDVWGIAKDRNHIVAHGEKSNAAWCTYAEANLGIDAHCNTHTDPGPYWDWTLFMGMINNQPVNRAEVISVTAPSTVNAGATFSATVKVRNIGNSTWTTGAYALGSQNPQDNIRWGTNRVALANAVAPGNTNTFIFTCIAPVTPAIYPFEWKMTQEGVEWFGGTAASTINVGNAQPVSDIIVDNPSASIVGTWSAGTSSTDKYGTDYRYKSAGTGTAWVEFRPNVLTGGNYNVYEWHPQGSNRATDAPVEINYNGGTQTVAVNQTINGGAWVLLGSFNFANGTGGCVRIKDNFTSGSVVMADAIKFVYVP